MKSRNLFLGVILLFIGIVALLVSIDVIDISWVAVWRLWPMSFVFAGITFLPVKEWLKALLLLAALTVCVLLYQYETSHGMSHWLFSRL